MASRLHQMTAKINNQNPYTLYISYKPNKMTGWTLMNTGKECVLQLLKIEHNPQAIIHAPVPRPQSPPRLH